MKSFLDTLIENHQIQIAGYYNIDKTDEERKIRNAVIQEYSDLIAIYKEQNQPTEELSREGEQCLNDIISALNSVKRVIGLTDNKVGLNTIKEAIQGLEIFQAKIIPYIYDFAWNYGRFYHIGDASKIIDQIKERLQLPEEFLSGLNVSARATEAYDILYKKFHQYYEEPDQHPEWQIILAAMEEYKSTPQPLIMEGQHDEILKKFQELLGNKKIDWDNYQERAKDCWLFLTNDKMPHKAMVSKEAFLHEVGVMLDGVNQLGTKQRLNLPFPAHTEVTDTRVWVDADSIKPTPYHPVLLCFEKESEGMREVIKTGRWCGDSFIADGGNPLLTNKVKLWMEIPDLLPVQSPTDTTQPLK